MAGRPKEFDPSEALGAALEVFWQCGFDGVGMERLLKEMGVGRQSAYDTFGGKREIFLKALDAYVLRVRREIEGVLLHGGGSPAGRVKKFLRAVEERTAGGSQRGCLITNTIVELAPHDAEVRRVVSGVLAGLEEILAGVLREAQRAGELGPGKDPRKLARLIVVTFEGALVMAKTEQAGVVRDALRLVAGMVADD